MYLDVPASAHRLINVPAFPPVFTLYVVLVWGCFAPGFALSMFSDFDLPKPT